MAVSPAAASIMTVAGFPSSTTAGVAHEFTITALDAYGNIATGYTGMVHFSSSDAQAVLPSNSTLTDGTGQFSGTGQSFATLNTPGTQSLTATDTTNTSLTGTQGGITVYAAVLASASLRWQRRVDRLDCKLRFFLCQFVQCRRRRPDSGHR